MEDQPRFERLREIHRLAVVKASKEDPTLTTEKLADDFDCGHATINRVLKAAGNKWKKGPIDAARAHSRIGAQRQKIAQKLVEVDRTVLGVAGCHSLHSPDMLPSDYHLFRKLEHFLNKKKFGDISHLRRGLTALLNPRTMISLSSVLTCCLRGGNVFRMMAHTLDSVDEQL
ncbi:hypothetical protein KIN20_003501 [Parelaphostrongylus tenuis]|uniref:Uncharacterized protein n=1 Tax=Parelaphostrongylus tenuis TaxID=148309 RepID=A0AAD5LZ90_PARTN|nr:hypothetical protein KIN20_003501 [Parelaphostrongylus tenuis]